PREEVGVRRPGARQRLVQVVVRVDEAGRDDGAVQVLAGLRRVARAESRDQPLLDLQPAARVLAAGIVHRPGPAVLDEHGPATAESLMPTTTTLCASCATVEAIAPRCRPKPRTNPRPVRPVPRCRSITAILARSRAGSATASPPRTVGSSTSESVTIWPGTSPITRALPPLHGIRKTSGPSAPIRTVC